MLNTLFLRNISSGPLSFRKGNRGILHHFGDFSLHLAIRPLRATPNLENLLQKLSITNGEGI